MEVWQKLISTSIVILLELEWGIKRDMRYGMDPPIGNKGVMNS